MSINKLFIGTHRISRDHNSYFILKWKFDQEIVGSKYDERKGGVGKEKRVKR